LGRNGQVFVTFWRWYAVIVLILSLAFVALASITFASREEEPVCPLKVGIYESSGQCVTYWWDRF
jgi:hypothetical protein